MSRAVTTGRRGAAEVAGRPGAAAAGSQSIVPSAPRRYRPELHGLRGVAILLVVLYHVWFDRVSGGVDVFLFISAFLLTGAVVRRIERGEPTRPIASWARTFKRLLAPAAVVVLGTLLLARLFLPASAWPVMLADAAGSLLHVQNWVLIERSVDYYAQSAGASPFQHFWSLSVQGQIFVLWPLLLSGGALFARTLRLPPRPVLVVLFATIGVASLAWSVYSTGTQQAVAYFDTAARAWQFAAGSLLALALPLVEQAWASREGSAAVGPGGRFRVPRAMMGWIGLLALLACGALLDVQQAFPGWIAAWPLAGAALVIIAGATGLPWAADRLLSTRAAAFLGDVSYALYLVHWPLLVVWLVVSGRERAGVLDGAALIALCLMLAYGLTRVVDTPVRRWSWANARPLRSGVVATATLAIGLAPVIGAQALMERAQTDAERTAHVDNPGARVLDAQYQPHPAANTEAGPVPSVETVGQDWVDVTEPCADELRPQDPLLQEACHVTEGPADAPLIGVVGSSRMQQLSGVLLPLAEEHGWRVMMLWRNSCPFAPGTETRGAECTAFNAAAAEHLEQVDPEAVATTTTLLTYEETEVLSPGMGLALPRLREGGTDVLAFRDQPRLTFEPNSCVEQHGADAPECTAQTEDMFAAERPDAELLAAADGAGAGTDAPAQVDARAGAVHPVDLTSTFCPDGTCSPVIGNVRVYLDENHVSATYARSAAGHLEAELERTGWQW